MKWNCECPAVISISPLTEISCRVDAGKLRFSVRNNFYPSQHFFSMPDRMEFKGIFYYLVDKIVKRDIKMGTVCTIGW